MKLDCAFTLNGAAVTVEVRPTDRLIDALRGSAGLTGTKEGCGNGECGACTVLVDGRAINSCLYPALEAEGREVITIEGLTGANGKLSALQQAFVDEGGIQCGFCTPGMIMAAEALLRRTPRPTEAQIREALVGNLCRCTGYAQIVGSVQVAAERRQAEGAGGSHD